MFRIFLVSSLLFTCVISFWFHLYFSCCYVSSCFTLLRSVDCYPCLFLFHKVSFISVFWVSFLLFDCFASFLLFIHCQPVLYLLVFYLSFLVVLYLSFCLFTFNLFLCLKNSFFFMGWLHNYLSSVTLSDRLSNSLQCVVFAHSTSGWRLSGCSFMTIGSVAMWH